MYNTILAQDVVSTQPMPPFAASIMDGYAIVASNGVGVYPVVESIEAGDDVIALKVAAGEVAWITTGSSLPKGESQDSCSKRCDN